MGFLDDLLKRSEVKDLALGVVGGVVSILGTSYFLKRRPGKEVDEDDDE